MPYDIVLSVYDLCDVFAIEYLDQVISKNISSHVFKR